MSGAHAFQDEPKIGAERARRTAEKLIELISPVCEQIEVWGSLRRGREFVGDVEIGLVPRFGGVVVPDGMFEREDNVNLEFTLVNRLADQGVLQDRLSVTGQRARGERFQRMLFEGVAVDLFCCLPPAQWGCLKTIRTGHRDWTQPRLSSWCAGGKSLPPGMYIEGGALYKNGRAEARYDEKQDRHYQVPVGGELVPTPTEEEFFAAIGLDWTEPHLREAR